MAKTKEIKTVCLFGEPVVQKPKEDFVDMKPSKSTVWDYVNMMFSNPKEFDKILNYEKGSNFFMLQRTFAIKYPLQAAALNLNGINHGEVVNYWAQSIGPLYSKSPSWIYQAFKEVKAKKQVERAKINNIPEEVILKWCQLNYSSKREFNEILEYCGQEFLKELKVLEEIM